MKKNLFMVAAVALVALVSCNKETNSPLQPAPVSDIKFEAEFVNEQTKTSIGDADKNGYRNVTWDLGELVHINGTLFTATDYKEDGKAIFVTEDLDFATAEKYDAIYPASAGKSLDAVTIPAAQDGTFANAAIAVAQSENRSLAFMNVASLIKFQVESDCSTITITSNLNLTGKVSVTFDENGYPVLGSTVSEPSKTVTLTGAFKAGQDYYVAALPGSHTFTVRIDSYLSKAGTKPVTLTRSNIVNLKAFPEPDLLYLVPNNNWKSANARFAAYFYNSDTDNKWVEITNYKGSLVCQKEDYSHVIFCRMNPATTENNWNNKWDQTGNLTVGKGKYCVIPFDVWGGLTQWSDSKTFNTTNKVFLAPGENWRADGARFEAYFWGSNGNQWVTLSLLSDNPVYYFAEHNVGMTGMKFLRKDPNSKEHDFGQGVWAQTGDLTVSDGKFWTTTGWDGAGSWGSK